jgi:DNA-directed RNA polymerase subunit RPC12/RpoP
MDTAQAAPPRPGRGAPQAPAQKHTLQESLKAEALTARFHCTNCTSSFELEVGKGTPQCPKCASVALIAQSPIASAHISGNERPLTQSEIKRIRFIRHNYRQYVQFQDAITSMTSMFQRLGLSQGTVDSFKKRFELATTELDQLHKEKLQLYDKTGGKA